MMPRPLYLLLALIAFVAVALPVAVVLRPPAMPAPPAAPPPAPVVAPTALPPVEPMAMRDVTPEDARQINEDVPFADGPVPAASPFRFTGSTDDLARATDCLAAAGYYEAGDDAEGQRAVDQVVLNRLRHPAFPKTVCGVVFQGSERATGCQFTFTCDGAMARTPSDSAWKRAREVAAAALKGAVYKPVGWATHYHTDWVVPYWSASLDKIARQGTHLFFRWTGWWGTPAAFTRRQLPGEAPIGQLARLSDAHRLGAALTEAGEAFVEAVPFFGRTPAPLPGQPDTFLTSLNPAQADSFSAMALAACGDRATCRVMGWTDPDQMAFKLPLSPDQMAGMSFSYIRNRASGLDRTLWNCTEFKGRSPCMKRQVLRIVRPAIDPTPAVAPVTTLRGPAELEGVRRKPAPAVTSAPVAGGDAGDDLP